MVKRKDACDSLPKSSQEVFSATMLMSTWRVVANLRVTADLFTHLLLAARAEATPGRGIGRVLVLSGCPVLLYRTRDACGSGACDHVSPALRQNLRSLGKCEWGDVSRVFCHS